jgi:hypothetical protein
MNFYLTTFTTLVLSCLACRTIKPDTVVKTGSIVVKTNNIHTGKKDIFAYGEAVLKRYGYQAAFDSLAALRTEYENPETPETSRSIYYQSMMTFASFCGQHNTSLEYEAKAFPGRKPEIPVFPQRPVMADVRQYILEKYSKERVLLFNEAHNRGQHRTFMRSLLPDLYRAGFRYLAVESIDIKDTMLMARGYPTQKSGYYVREPAFGQLIRDALQIGFSIVAYEDTTANDTALNYQQNLNKREKIQADNLVRALQRDTAGKMIVWAGHSHINKQSNTEWITMGQHLCGALQRDIPAFESTAMREGHDAEHENGVFRYAVDSFQHRLPGILLEAGVPYLRPNARNKVTLHVFYPRTDYALPYPDWMKESDDHFYTLRIKSPKKLDHKLLHVYKANEWNGSKTEAIPVLLFPLTKNTETVKLYLKKGQYHAFVFDTYQKVLYQKTFSVK